MLGLVVYALNGMMRFYYVGDEKCMSRKQAEGLKREFMSILQKQIMQEEQSTGAHPVIPATVAH